MAAAEVSTPAAEVQSSLVVPCELVERVVRDSYREEWEVKPRCRVLMVDLVEGQVVMDGQGVREEEEGTLEEAVAIIAGILVEAVEDLIMLVNINKMTVAIDQMVMVR